MSNSVHGSWCPQVSLSIRHVVKSVVPPVESLWCPTCVWLVKLVTKLHAMHSVRFCLLFHMYRSLSACVSVCLSVCLLVTRVSPANAAEPIEVPFSCGLLGPRNSVLMTWGLDGARKRALFWGGHTSKCQKLPARPTFPNSFASCIVLQCFDTVGWASGRTSGL